MPISSPGFCEALTFRGIQNELEIGLEVRSLQIYWSAGDKQGGLFPQGKNKQVN